MRLIGHWGDPITAVTNDEVAALQSIIKKNDCKCAFCGSLTRLTPKTPLGHFNVCLRDVSLPDEPINWVPLCEICSDLNSIQKIKGKGSFVEASWISQGRLTNILKASYAISIRNEFEWGGLREGAEKFLSQIDALPTVGIELGWDGSINAIERALSQNIHPFPPASYINTLRYRFDLEAYREAIEFWATEYESIAANNMPKRD